MQLHPSYWLYISVFVYRTINHRSAEVNKAQRNFDFIPSLSMRANVMISQNKCVVLLIVLPQNQPEYMLRI